MSAAQEQSSLNSARGAGTRLGPDSGDSSSGGTPAMSVGSATAAGHGQHPRDNADDSNAQLTGSKYGVQQENLEGDQMSAPGEGDVMDAQLNKDQAGWGEEESLTSDLDRKKKEQQGAREDVQQGRQQGYNVDGGAGGRVSNEGLNQA